MSTEVLVRAGGLDVNEVPDGYIIYQMASTVCTT